MPSWQAKKLADLAEALVKAANDEIGNPQLQALVVLALPQTPSEAQRLVSGEASLDLGLKGSCASAAVAVKMLDSAKGFVVSFPNGANLPK
jgi:hypothetical protein